MKNLESNDDNTLENIRPISLRLANLELDKEWTEKFQGFKDWVTERFHKIDLKLNKLENSIKIVNLKLNWAIAIGVVYMTASSYCFYYIIDNMARK
jgi:hypothetical protein